MKFLQLSFMNFVGEELTVFGFLKEECEKNFENHWLGQTGDFYSTLLCMSC